MTAQPIDMRDLSRVARCVPKDVRDLLSQNAPKLIIGGGFIRAIIAGEQPSDIDIFSDTRDSAKKAADALCAVRKGSRVITTDNAVTVLATDKLPVQFITRWTFDKPEDVIASFDFTVCQAAFWHAGPRGIWKGAVGDRFYTDLASRRLVYTQPVREEAAGGSMLRVMKYVRRGYNIQQASLAQIMARVAAASTFDRRRPKTEREYAYGIGRLLIEVDPLSAIPGLDATDPHAPVEGLPVGFETHDA